MKYKFNIYNLDLENAIKKNNENLPDIKYSIKGDAMDRIGRYLVVEMDINVKAGISCVEYEKLANYIKENLETNKFCYIPVRRS